MMNICPIEECTGCTACYNICPQSAITFCEDERGFIYPDIKESLCVNCGLCRKVCPNNASVSRSVDQEAYVATAKSIDEQRTSTSGGLASVLARYIIRKGGVVYGCSGMECSDVHHIRIQTESEIDYIKGSKYVQSRIGICYKEIKNDLLQGIQVLFIGTPCQCAGLRSFLMKGYDNLLTVDFVCHGVPSQRILNDAIRYNIKQDDLNGLSVQFRYREEQSGHSVYGLQLKKDGKVVFQSKWPENDYITGFLRGVFYRESCYSCKYATPDRVSDITLGDYWDRKKERNISKGALGLSSLICNSERGKCFFNECLDNIYREPVLYEILVNSNGQLRKPIVKSSSVALFKNKYVKKGYMNSSKEVLTKEMKRTRRALFRGRIVTYLKKLSFLNHKN